MFTPGDRTRTKENLFPAFVILFSRQTEKQQLSSRTLFITSLFKKDKKYDELGEITTNTNKYNFVYLFYLGVRKSGLKWLFTSGGGKLQVTGCRLEFHYGLNNPNHY